MGDECNILSLSQKRAKGNKITRKNRQKNRKQTPDSAYRTTRGLPPRKAEEEAFRDS
jgi:hypothetical protein